MDPIEEIKQTFFQECEELLAELETGLLTLRAGDGDEETVNAVFRAVHSVKGGAGAFALDNLVSFSHVFETVMEEMRSECQSQSRETFDVLLRAADLLVDLVREARGGAVVATERTTLMTTELNNCLAQNAASPASECQSEDQFEPLMEADALGFVPQQIIFDDLDGDIEPTSSGQSAQIWSIVFAPHNDLYATANDAVVLLRELSRLGEIDTVLAMDSLPALDAIEPEHAYFSWTIQLTSDCSEDDIREVFDFVEDECDLEIRRLSNDIQAAPDTDTITPAPNDIDRFDAARSELLGTDPASDALISDTRTATTEAEPDETVETPAITETPQAQQAASPQQSTIRVDLDRVDILINLVGELVINQSMLAQHAGVSGFSKEQGVGTGLDELERLTREIQDSVMAIRAQPVKSVFQRMPRLVREISAQTGKIVRLETEGETTEVDKTVIEKLTDPLTHMIRNAIDHGLETPEQRTAAGKPAEGVVRMSANHRSGRIIIQISDDGAGINRDRVLEIARHKGLISHSEILSHDEIDNLIFKPGFSTAEEVSSISGRGVGMDVVKRSIESLGGRISISSTPGTGSVFTMSLPLTLAVLDGMVITVGDQALIVPLNNVIETLSPRAHKIKYLGPHERVMALRDQHVPLVDLGHLMGLRDHLMEPSGGVCILVENDAGAQIALLVDDILGQRQVVIKSLEQNYRKVDLIAAATILGDGRVALIVDIDAVICSRQSSSDHTIRPLEQTSLAS